MYSGSTLTNVSGNVFGAHQKIDKVARKALSEHLVDNHHFPSIRKILHFEGKNGPDGIKRKSPAKDEPWHYYDPFDPEDGQLIELINEHLQLLTQALKQHNTEKSAFEAAWLAHAVVDGLTPAHHYPYETELEKLRGEGKETRTTVKAKLIMPGDTKRAMVKNNWHMWGAKGLLTTHFLFEIGAAMLFAPMHPKFGRPNTYDIKTLKHIGYEEYFKRIAREVALLNMYEEFYKRGWTPKLAQTARKELAPLMGSTVALAWYQAALGAGLAK
jgi:hypothetical protein